MVNTTQKFGVSINSYHYLILQILEREKKPLTVQEIMEKLSKITKLGGKRPSGTITAILLRSKYVEKVDRNSYNF